MRVNIKLDILNEVLAYLGQMPYAQVHQLIKKVMDDVNGNPETKQDTKACGSPKDDVTEISELPKD